MLMNFTWNMCKSNCAGRWWMEGQHSCVLSAWSAQHMFCWALAVIARINISPYMHSDAGIWEKHLCVFLLRMENNNNHWVFAGICTPLRKTSFNTKSWVGLLSAPGNVSTRSFSALIAKITSKCIQSKDKQSKWTFSCYRRNIVSLLDTFVYLQYLHHHVKLGSLNVTHWVFMFPVLTGYTPSFGHKERSSSRLIHFVCLWGVITAAEATPIRSVCLHVKGHFSGQLCSDWQGRSL